MTPKVYEFVKNMRIAMIIFSSVTLIFFAGAIFTGYEPNLSNYVVIFFAILQLINALVNKPTPPNEQTTRETSETK